MKQNVRETENNWQSKKLYLMSPSRHNHFHPILDLPAKMVELPHQHAKTYVYWL